MAVDIDAARTFVLREGRLLERRRLARMFDDEPTETTMAALLAYQNLDGGFGHAIEPDLRTSTSQPQGAEVALRIMCEIGHLDVVAVGRLADWLATVTTTEGGVPFALPNAKEEPHAPWWAVEDDPPADLNPTAAIVGLLQAHGIDHPWLEPATAFCWRQIETAGEPTEEHAFVATFTFLEHVPDRRRAEGALRVLGTRAVEEGHITLDVDAGDYVHTPLDIVTAPDALTAGLFTRDVLGSQLDALERRQQEDGGWPIAWEPPSRAAELEWRAIVTVQALRTLRAWGRL